MKKLTFTKVKWIIQQKKKGKKTNEEIAETCKITKRRVQQLYSEHKRTGEVPVLKRNRRPRKFLTEEEKTIIDEAYNEMFFGARMLRSYIRVKYGKNINHNRIHRYLLKKNYAKENPRKQKKRKRCRYEREHSLSLLHTDWLVWNEKQVIAYQDDASRKILSIGEFNNATTANSIKVLKRAEKYVENFDTNIRAINTDRGSQFIVTKYLSVKESKNEFQKYLEKKEIRHVPSRRHNPQTNGKMERWVQEYKKHRHRFKSGGGFMNWYNNRMHGSLNMSKAETPNEAFIRKMRSEVWLKLFYKNVAK